MTQPEPQEEIKLPEKKMVCPVCLAPVQGRCETHNLPGVDSMVFSSDSPLHMRRQQRPEPKPRPMTAEEFQLTQENITHQQQPDVQTF